VNLPISIATPPQIGPEVLGKRAGGIKGAKFRGKFQRVSLCRLMVVLPQEGKSCDQGIRIRRDSGVLSCQATSLISCAVQKMLYEVGVRAPTMIWIAPASPAAACHVNGEME
jgi:hypothetical protein